MVHGTWRAKNFPHGTLAGTPLPRAASPKAHCVRLGGRLIECSSPHFLNCEVIAFSARCLTGRGATRGFTTGS